MGPRGPKRPLGDLKGPQAALGAPLVMSAPAEVTKTVATLATLPQLQQQAVECGLAYDAQKPHAQWRPAEVEQLRFQIMRAKEQDIVERSRGTAKKLSNLMLQQQQAMDALKAKAAERY